MGAIAGKKGRVYGPTASVSTALTNEATTADASRIAYTITNTARRYLDPSVVPIIETTPDGTTWTATTAYSEIQYAGGVVVFPSARAVGTQVRFKTGSYFPMAPVANITGWSMDAGMDMKDSTCLGDSWKKQTPTVLNWAGKLNQLWVDNYFLDKVVAGSLIALVLYVDEAGDKHYEGYVYLSKDGTELDVTDLVKKGVEFTGNGPVYPR